MWNNFQSFIGEKERIWGDGTKTVGIAKSLNATHKQT
jgi:hypothetical protein